MLSIYEILSIDESTEPFGPEFQAGYDALIKQYHPEKQPDAVIRLALFLRDGDANDMFEYEHKCEALEALTQIADTGQPLPLATLSVLSELLLDVAAPPEIHVSCCLILTLCARGKSQQLLPLITIRILESILEYADNTLLNYAADALCGVSYNDQPLSPPILQLAESAFIRQQEDKLAIAGLLYQLIKQPTQHALSSTTYEALDQIIREADPNALALQNTCYNIIAASARNGHEIPGPIFETLSIMLQHTDQPIREKAFSVLMTCITDEKNRRNIPPETFVDILAATEQALIENHPITKKYATCIAGHCIIEQRPELEEWLDSQTHPTLNRHALIQSLEARLQEKNPQTPHYEILTLSHLLKQASYGLFEESQRALKFIIDTPDQSLALKKTSIECMGLSIRNGRNIFSDDELKSFKHILIQAKPELTQTPSPIDGRRCPTGRMRVDHSWASV